MMMHVVMVGFLSSLAGMNRFSLNVNVTLESGFF